MNRTKPILAKDIMKADVVRFDASTPIETAIETLDELDISGAPVTDDDGRLLGILTTRDVTRAEHVRSGRIAATRGDFSMSEPTGDVEPEDENENVILNREDYSPAVTGTDTVADWMNRNVVTVPPEATLREVCQKMAKEHVHRVVVARCRMVAGIITSFDVVRCVADGASI
jgi:CBS domain-containing protein